MTLMELFRQGDAITQAVAVLLLAMSVASWVVILWKTWLLRRAGTDVARSTAASGNPPACRRRSRRWAPSTARPWCCR
jgi:biopolymer transport protein ExbB